MKKQISLIAVLAMIITTIFSSTVFADTFSDVTEDNRYRDAILTLNKLGVINGYEDGSFKPEGQITRGEFTKMVVAALGYGSNTTKASEFDDAVDHWSSAYIKTAYDLKIVNGTGERTFEPDNPVTYEQALKMLVCTLNYGLSAEANGGYPQGYINQAQLLKITTNIVDQANSNPATRQVIAQAVYNALEVKMLELDPQLGVWETSDKTILNDYLKVIRLEGTLIGAEDTKTNECTVNLIKNQIAIKATKSGNIVVINLGDFDELTIGALAKMIGNEMTVYYSQGISDEDKELKVVDAETSANSTVTVSYKKFSGFDGSSFKYVEGPSKKTLKVASDATIIYNGQAVVAPVTVNGVDYATSSELLAFWLSGSLNIKGEVTFTDAGDDGDQNIITINDYQTLIALKAPTTTDYRVQNKLKTGEYLSLDPEDINTKLYIERDGKEIAPTAIRANDVVTYTKSLDGTIINAYVSSKTVSGTVNSINNTDNTITISNTEYDLDVNCAAYMQSKDSKTLASGITGTFYLDKLGTVIYGTVTEAAASPYGYIINIYPGDDGQSEFVTYYDTSKKTTQSIPLAEKVKINGKETNDAAGVLSNIVSTYNTNPDDGSGAYPATSNSVTNGTYSQPVRIKVSSNTVTDIYTLQDSTLARNDDSTKLARYRSLDNYYYLSSGFKKNSTTTTTEFKVSSSTTVLFVPQDRSERSKYSKKTVSSAFSNYESYYVEAYDVNESNVASLVIMYGTGGTLNKWNALTDYSVVAAKSNATDNEGNPVKQISVYAGTSTELKKWNALKDDEFDSLVQGDVIQFDYDDDDKVQNTQVIVSYADVEAILNDTAGVDVTYDEGVRRETFNWSDSKFDFKKTGNGTASRAIVRNVYQVPEDATKLYLTKEGFEKDADSIGKLRDDALVEIEEVTINSNTKILRMEKSGSTVTFSPYAAGTSTELTLADLKDAKSYGESCSTVFIATTGTTTSTAKLIIVYPDKPEKQ